MGAATPFAGTDRFEGVRLAWACGAAAVPVETSVRVYGSLSSVTSATRGAAAAIFTQRWPRGAKGTAVGPPAFSNVGDAGNAQEQVASVFPAISVATAAEAARRRLRRPDNATAAAPFNYFVYRNQMVGGMADGTQYGAWDGSLTSLAGGTMGGPIVIWGGGDEDGAGGAGGAGGAAVVLSPVTNAMAMNMVFNNATKCVEVGTLGSIIEIPANYTAETMLYVSAGSATSSIATTTTAATTSTTATATTATTGSSCAPYRCGGPNAAVSGFGVALRRYMGKDTGFPAGGFDADPTLAYVLRMNEWIRLWATAPHKCVPLRGGLSHLTVSGHVCLSAASLLYASIVLHFFSVSVCLCVCVSV